MPSLNRDIAKILGKTEAINPTNAALSIAGSGGSGLSVYATLDDLPTTGLTAGDQAFVTATSRLYISNGSGWYNVALINATPSLTIDPTGAIELSTEGATTAITLTATDSDNAVAGLTYSVESDGSFAGLGTISQDSSVFTITPLSEDSATTGTSTLTFKASDGISFGSGQRTFTLTFISSAIENSNYTILLAKADTAGTDNQVDASTNNYTVTENGNVTSTALTPYHPGGYSTYFDGSGDKIENGSGELTGQTATTFTIEAWVNMTASPTNTSQYLASMFVDGSDLSNSIYLFSGPDNDRIPVIRWYDTGEKYCKGTTALNLNQWYHLAYVVNNNDIKIYVNGVEETTSGTSTYTNWGGSRIGWQVGENNYGSFKGHIKDLRVTNTAVYTSAFTAPTESLTAISGTQLLICHAPYLRDGSSQNLSLTIAGNTSTKRFSPYDYESYTKADHGGSVYFPGTYSDYLNFTGFTFTGDYTAECWAYSTSVGANYNVIFYGGGNTQLNINAGGVVGQMGTVLQGSVRLNSTQTGANLNEWVHYVWEREGSVHRIYANGKLIATNTTAVATFTIDTIGRYGAASGYEFAGYLSDVRLTNAAVYGGSDFNIPTAPLTAIANTQLLTCTNKNDIWDAGAGSRLIKVGNATSSNTIRNFLTSSSVYFDGTGDLISVQDDIQLRDGDFTIEAWVYCTNLANDSALMTIISQRNSASGQYWRLGIIQGTGAVSFRTDISDLILVENGSIPVNQWRHIAVTRSGDTARLFINGDLQATDDTAAKDLYMPDVPIRIGSAESTPNYFWKGYIQDVRITKGLARYTANFTPPTAEFEG